MRHKGTMRRWLRRVSLRIGGAGGRRRARRFVLPRVNGRLPRINTAGFLFAAVWFVAGAVVGGVHGNADGASALPPDYLAQAARSAPTVLDAGVKYGKWLAALWLLARAPALCALCPMIVFARGYGLGMAAAALTRAFGGAGVAYTFALCFPQNAVVTPFYLYAAYDGLARFTALFTRAGASGGNGLACAGAYGLAALVAGAAEAFVTPVLAGLLAP